jgi:hypothetical protein
MYKIIMVVFLMMFICTYAYAEEKFIDKHEVSIGYAPFCKHLFSDNEDYNETINAVMGSVDQWFIMTFKNSSYNRTFAVGYALRTDKWKFDDKWFLRGNLNLSLIHGYDDELFNVGGIAPAIGPTVELGYKNFSVQAMVIPVATLMFVWTF